MQYKYFADYKPITNVNNSILTASIHDNKALIITKDKNNKNKISQVSLLFTPKDSLPLSYYKNNN